MEIEMFSGKSLSDLHLHIAENYEHYFEKTPFTKKYFSESDYVRKNYFDSTISVPDFTLIPGKEATNDAENSRRLYESFRGNINRVQATDRRIWTYLTHETFWSYMQSRWPVSTEGTVGDRYFCDRGMLRNGIARLYWAAELSYDSVNDSYEYTDFLLSRQDLLSQMDRSFTKNRKVLLASLKVLRENARLSEDRQRAYFTQLRQAGGATLLDAMPAEQIEALCCQIYDHIKEETFVGANCRLVLQQIGTSQKMIVEIHNREVYFGKTPFNSITWNQLRRMKIGSNLKIRKGKYRIIEIIEDGE